MSENAVELRNVNKIYRNGVGHHALKDVNLVIEKGEFLAIVGPSGSGKSTLLNLIGLLDTPTSGEIYIRGVDVTKISQEERARIRNQELGFIFQYHYLLPDFTALENVMMPLLIARKSKAEAEKTARDLLELMGLGARMDHKFNQLSGGENQRVAVARALANNPAIVLGDEPTGNLDTKTSDAIYELLRHLNLERKQTFIIVTHNLDLAKKADRIIKLVDGIIIIPD
ncbi:MAG: ABC transporter ATP-binding protein [Methanocellales archaeon]